MSAEAIDLIEAGRLDEARIVLERSIRVRPTDIEALSQLGHVQERLGRRDESYRSFQRAYALAPTDLLVAKNLVSAELNAGRAEQAFEIAETVLSYAGRDDDFYALWLLAATSAPTVSASALHQRHREYSRRFDDAAAQFDFPARAPGEPLNVAYFSHHFYQFPLASFVQHIMRLHDRSTIRVFGFMVGGQIDEVTHEYARAADEFYDLASMDDDEAAAFIRSKRIDVLVDLSGYVQKNRFNILRKRVAPLQMSWLGYLGSYGSPAIDFHITDPLATPVSGGVDRFTEGRMWLLARSFLIRPLCPSRPGWVIGRPWVGGPFGLAYFQHRRK